MSSEVDRLLAIMTDILNEDAPNKWVWKTHASQDEWLRAKVLPALRDAQRALSASPSIGRVVVKGLVWRQLTSPREDGPADLIAEWEADCAVGTYIIKDDGGEWWLLLSDLFDTRQIGRSSDPDILRSMAQADYEARILSALVYHEEPAGDTQGALAVRPLKWEPSGRYPFVAMSDYYDIGHQSGDGRYWVHHRIFGDLREGDGTIEHHLTLDAAKAAAQEDHERKILWQIVGSSDPDVAPPNVEHLHPLADREKSAALVSPPDNGEPVAAPEIADEI